jgi:ankyrin repeat protein/HPt (histidine-containing phosphotransfer) domain-containing protein
MSNQHLGCGAESLTTHTASSQVSEVCSQCYDLLTEQVDDILNDQEKYTKILHSELTDCSSSISRLEEQLREKKKKWSELQAKMQRAQNIHKDILSRAILTHDHNLLQYIISKCVLNKTDQKLFSDCFKADNIEAFKLLAYLIDSEVAIEEAIREGANKCLIYLCENKTFNAWTDEERIPVGDHYDDRVTNRYNKYTRLAAEKGNAAALKLLIERGCTIMDEEVLNLAATKGSIECLKVAFEAGCQFDLDHNDCKGYTALQYAAERNHADCLRYLLEETRCGEWVFNVEDVLERVEVPADLLACCVRNGSWDCMKYLLNECKIPGVVWLPREGPKLINSLHLDKSLSEDDQIELINFAIQKNCESLFTLNALFASFECGMTNVLEAILKHWDDNKFGKLDLYELVDHYKRCSTPYDILTSEGYSRSFLYFADGFLHGPWNYKFLTGVAYGIGTNPESFLDDSFCRWLTFNPDRFLKDYDTIRSYLLEFDGERIPNSAYHTIKKKQTEIEAMKSISLELIDRITKDVIVYNLQKYF